MEQRDFFISYTNADEAWAVWIANVLKIHGYTVYIQALDIKPGDDFLEKMNEFLKNSRNFIAVWSKAYPKSRFCMAELQSAFYAWNKEKMDCLLPVRIDDYPLEPLYAGLVYVDLFNRGAVSETKLIDAVRYAVPRSVAPQETLPQKDAETLYQRGKDYFYGFYDRNHDFTKSYAKAREYYEKAAAKGHADALYNLGDLYARALSVARDCVKAREYYEKAAAKGHAGALCSLGFFYEEGIDVEKDYAKAREYYEKAAEKGSIHALIQLTHIYEDGRGVNIDYAKALEYCQKAADAGSGSADFYVEYLREKLKRQ